MEEILLEIAQTGLLRAARALERKGTAKAKKLARTLRSAHEGITAYLDSEESK